ncbi:MAG: methyltransferase domain-containing protein [Clostridiales bacterium]|nr:methyltransferase domain-containing protein [Clostridiales bacterium]
MCKQHPVPTFVQLNTTKLGSKELSDIFAKDGINCRSHAFLPNCLEISDSGSIGELYGHGEGLFYVQDPAARLSVLAAAPKAGDRVLDACAAPGGKSFAAAMMMEDKGEIISCDLHKNKLSRIKTGAEHLGLSIISTKTMDAAQPEEGFFESFDLVIADVPCSGLGVIRKKPDIRYKNTAGFKNLPELQLSILKGLAPCVKKGGSLLYSTCTLLPEENEGLIARFLELHPSFSPEDFILPEPIGQSHNGMLSLYPHIHGTDGFFICKLRKSNEN